jgi:hypothetical protein
MELLDKSGNLLPIDPEALTALSREQCEAHNRVVAAHALAAGAEADYDAAIRAVGACVADLRAAEDAAPREDLGALRVMLAKGMEIVRPSNPLPGLQSALVDARVVAAAAQKRRSEARGALAAAVQEWQRATNDAPSDFQELARAHLAQDRADQESRVAKGQPLRQARRNHPMAVPRRGAFPSSQRGALLKQMSRS